MDLLTAIGIFVVTLLVIEGGYFAFTKIRNPEVKRVRKRLSTLTLAEYQTEDVDIIRRKLLSEIPWFNRILLSLRRTDRANRLLEQAGTQYPLGFYILLSLVLAAVGFLGGLLLTSNYLFSIPVAAILSMMPFFYIHLKKKRRMQKFERQLPDAMDLIARSLRAGHAFTGGLKMVADEFDDPMGTEFDKTLNEINFGVGVVEGLKTLANRVDCRDLKFFVISVILQRETGGNLAEILENIARLIRERFKLYGRIRVLSAEGKLSAIILIAIPIFVAFALSIMNPQYIKTLITDPLGRIMIVFAISMMIVGIFVMRRMIKIKV
jgi:tight adherence protein B